MITSINHLILENENDADKVTASLCNRLRAKEDWRHDPLGYLSDAEIMRLAPLAKNDRQRELFSNLDARLRANQQ